MLMGLNVFHCRFGRGTVFYDSSTKPVYQTAGPIVALIGAVLVIANYILFRKAQHRYREIERTQFQQNRPLVPTITNRRRSVESPQQGNRTIKWTII